MIKVEMLPTENRCGIFSFQFSQTEGFSENTICIRLFNELNEPIFDEAMRVADLIDHGCHINVALLSEGEYCFESHAAKEIVKIYFKVAGKNELSRKIMESLKRKKTPIAFSAPCDSSYYPYEDNSCKPWFDNETAIDDVKKMIAQKIITEDEAEKFECFINNGFMIIEDAFDDHLIDLVNREIDHSIETGVAKYEYGSSKRIEHLHLHYPNIKKVWLNGNVKKYIDKLFLGLARPCQTLTFVFGSQQDAHQDTIHLTPFPAGYMCGMWIALQDVVEGSGELVVYPGSHKEPRFRMSEMNCQKVKNGIWSEFGEKIVPSWEIMSKKYNSFVYRPKKGTVLIWHENLLHAGSSRKDLSLERRSMVIHYFAEGSVAYYDSTGLPGMAAPLSSFD